jgi:hypothetical protein
LIAALANQRFDLVGTQPGAWLQFDDCGFGHECGHWPVEHSRTRGSLGQQRFDFAL